MTKGWYNHPREHALASRGIRTAVDVQTPVTELKTLGIQGYIQDDQGNPIKSGPIIDIAKEHFGTTDDFISAGYILPDGSMLDFSGVKFGGWGNTRQMDHREIQGIYLHKGGADAMIAFQKDTGAIRFGKSGDGDLQIDAFQKPTSQQIVQIGRAMQTSPVSEYVNIERTNEEGYSVDSMEMDSPSPVLVQSFVSRAW